MCFVPMGVKDVHRSKQREIALKRVARTARHLSPRFASSDSELFQELICETNAGLMRCRVVCA